MSPRVGVVFNDIDDAHGGVCLQSARHEFSGDVFLNFNQRVVCG